MKPATHITKRTEAALIAAEISINETLDMSDEELLAIKGIGQRGVDEIRTTIAVILYSPVLAPTHVKNRFIGLDTNTTEHKDTGFLEHLADLSTVAVGIAWINGGKLTRLLRFAK